MECEPSHHNSRWNSKEIIRENSLIIRINQEDATIISPSDQETWRIRQGLSRFWILAQEEESSEKIINSKEGRSCWGVYQEEEGQKQR